MQGFLSMAAEWIGSPARPPGETSRTPSDPLSGKRKRDMATPGWDFTSPREGKSPGSLAAEPPTDTHGRPCEIRPQEWEPLPPDWGRQLQIASLPGHSQALIAELFRIVCGEDETCAADDTVLWREPGYEKSAEQRAADCARVREILRSGAEGVHADLRWTYGESLLWCTLEYDHRHPPQMIAVVLDAGADPAMPNAMDGERPLDSRWLDGDGAPEIAQLNAQKRALIAAYIQQRARLLVT